MKKDWEIKKLGDVCEFLDSRRKPITANKRIKGEIPYYGATGILDYVADFLFDEELILLGEDGAKWGPGDKSAFRISGKTWVNNHAHVLKPRSIDYDWIIYFLNYSDLMKFVKGATVPKLNQENARNIPIPVPPLEEQKRIVKILDEKFAQLETIKANAQTNLQNAKDLFQSQLTKAFSNTTWEKKRLGDLCSKIGSGATPKGGRDSYKSEGIHLVRSMNVYDSKFVYDELACIDDKQAYELRNVELQENDVLFNITGASVCRCCVLPSEVLPARVNQHVSILRPKQEQLNPTFLCSAMLGYKEILYKMACVGGSTRQAITKSQLEDFEIPLPPLPEQKRIVKEVDALSEKVRQLQEIYTKQIANCDELKQSLLQKTFEGELSN